MTMIQRQEIHLAVVPNRDCVRVSDLRLPRL